MLQAASAMALAVHVGWEGSQVLFGIMLGVLSAYGMGAWAREVDIVLPGFAVFWYVFGGGAGFFSYTILRPLMLAILSSLAGGFLAIASMGVLLSRLYALIADNVAFMPDGIPWLPSPTEPVFHAAGDLLGVGGHYAIPWHCGCATIAAVVRCTSRIDWLAIVALVGSIGLELIYTVGCQLHWAPEGECPGLKTLNFPWMATGDVIWIALTSFAAYRQLHELSDWEVKSFWKALLPFGDHDEEAGSDSDHSLRTRTPGNDFFRTKAPQELGSESPASMKSLSLSADSKDEGMPALGAGVGAFVDYAKRTFEMARAQMLASRSIGLDACCAAGPTYEDRRTASVSPSRPKNARPGAS